MPLDVHQFPCLNDNYGFLIRDRATGKTATVDTPDAAAIQAELAKTGSKLGLILNTHWHPDHAGGNAALKAATGAEIYGPQEVEFEDGLLTELVADAFIRSGESGVWERVG